MNPLPEFLNSLTQAFKYCSLPDPIKRKQGENSLISLSFDQSYPISLLYLISNQSDFDLSLRSSIELKKWAQNYEVK